MLWVCPDSSEFKRMALEVFECVKRSSQFLDLPKSLPPKYNIITSVRNF